MIRAATAHVVDERCPWLWVMGLHDSQLECQLQYGHFYALRSGAWMRDALCRH